MEVAFYGFPLAVESLRQRSRRTSTESEDAYTYSVVLPGVGKKDVSVAVDGNAVAVEAASSSKWNGLSFEERFAVPRDADRDAVTAEMSNGVLRIIVPKLKDGKQTVEVAESGETDEDAHELTFQVPGASADDVKVELERDFVYVSARANGHNHFRSFTRRYQWPQDAKRDAVRAFCRNGVLVVSIGKVQPEAVPISTDAELSNGAYSVSLQIPGIDSEQFRLQRLNRQFTLSVSGKKGLAYEHRFAVPTKVDVGKVVAVHKNGVLTISGPRSENTRRQVAVQ